MGKEGETSDDKEKYKKQGGGGQSGNIGEQREKMGKQGGLPRTNPACYQGRT